MSVHFYIYICFRYQQEYSSTCAKRKPCSEHKTSNKSEIDEEEEKEKD